MSTNQPRVPAGVSTGGRFASTQHAEPDELDVAAEYESQVAREMAVDATGERVTLKSLYTAVPYCRQCGLGRTICQHQRDRLGAVACAHVPGLRDWVSSQADQEWATYAVGDVMLEASLTRDGRQAVLASVLGSYDEYEDEGARDLRLEVRDSFPHQLVTRLIHKGIPGAPPLPAELDPQLVADEELLRAELTRKYEEYERQLTSTPAWEAELFAGETRDG